MLKISIVFLATILNALTQSLPCPNNCLTCSSSTSCLTCASQYYPSSASGTLTCLACPQFCLQCISGTACTRCMDPYVLQTNGSCLACQISNALSCSSTVVASTCKTGFYAAENYCYNCLLNCASCSSNTDCRACMPGYFLNSSVLTCNFCPTNCLTCDQFNSTRCLTCASGFALSSGDSCSAIACTFANCVFCSSATQCGRCAYGYFWNSSAGACVLGASILCEFGAEGPAPNQCNNKCGEFAFAANQTGTAIWCVVYSHIKVYESVFSQLYLYSYNHLTTLQAYSGSASSLFLQSPGEYSYPLNPGASLSFASIPSYYQLIVTLKYRSQTALLINISATTEQLTQTQQTAIQAFPSVPALSVIRTVFVHSNNVRLAFNASVSIVEVLVRARRCPSTCFRCLNQDLCEMCQEPQYMSAYKCVDNCTIYYHLVVNRTCVATCPQTFFPANLGTNQKFCQPCVSPCLACLSATRCLTCVAGRFLLGSNCVTACPDTYYGGNGTCQSCISPCKLCTNQTACLSCELGFWDASSRVCTNLCPLGYFGSSLSSACEACQSPCSSCSNSSTRCLTCITGLYYFNYQCLSSCPSRYFPILANLTCAACQPPCFTCSSLTNCLSCSFNYMHNGACLSNCPTGYFQDISLRVCAACPGQCMACESTTECTSCTVGRCILQGSCLAACPGATYFRSVTLAGTASQQCECQQCIYPCRECLNSTACLSCLQGFLLGSQCLNTCPVGLYANTSTFQCLTCSSKFASCSECNSTQCTRCLAGLFLHNGLCLSSCPQFHFRSGQRCIRCVAPCLECSAFTSCLSCVTPFIFNSGQCIIQCPFGKISVLNSTTSIRSCISCQSPCVTCQNSDPSNCTMCISGSFLHSLTNRCVSQCYSLSPANSFYNEAVTSTCAKCMFPCRTCLTQTHCLTCQIGYLTSTNKCQNCPAATYASASGLCLACPSACSDCYSADYCIGCNVGFYLYGHNCVSDVNVCLQNGYYPIGRICQNCQSPCRTCNTSARDCLSCVSGYIFHLGRCLTECPRGAFLSNSTCQACDPFCQTCSGSATYCFSCKTSYLMILSSMKCVAACPIKTFLTGSTCQPCQYPCLECSSASHCLSCITGTLFNGSCLSSCLSGQYSDASMQCRPCQSPCSECENSATQCRRCEAGFYLFNSSCLPSCPSTFFGETQANLCLECLGLCGECSSHINCTTCENNLTYYHNSKNNYGQCVSQCPMSFYAQTVPFLSSSRQQCMRCLAACLTCQNNLQCVLCNGNKVQHLGSCLPDCPAQMYSHNGICQACSAPCFNCTDTFTCTACMDNSFLLVGSAECIVGEVCPQGFYRIPNTRLCNGKCPSGYYHRNDRTCNAQGCDVDEYKGADMFCYARCPDGYKSDPGYKCVACSGDQCQAGLFYEVTSEILGDQLYLYIVFTEQPQYVVYPPVLKLEPGFQFQVVQMSRGRLLAYQQMPPTRNITLQLNPSGSFTQQQLQVSFANALKTFSNPIQRTSKSIVIQGYDLYPSAPVINIGFLLLVCGLVGLVKNPYATDFAQLVYLLALVNLHYPANLASLLEDSRVAHLHGILHIEQKSAVGPAKFKYVADMGLLSNCVFNFAVIGIGLFLALILFAVYQILKKVVSYNKVQQEPNQTGENTLQAQIIVQTDEKKSVQVFRFLQTNFIENFYVLYLNRFIYFNYLPLAVFTFGQLSNLYFGSESSIDLVASVLSFLVLIGLIICPIYAFVKSKPKFSFLMLRKLILALVIIFSVENPTYMIGVTAVVSIMSGILVGAYGVEKWKFQSRFNSAMEISQTLLMVLFAIFAMIGEGNNTMGRFYLSWVIVALVIAICLGYLIFSVFCLGLWAIKKWKGVDYIELWTKQQSAANQSDNDSQTNGQTKKQEQDRGTDNNIKLLTAEKLFSNLSLPKGPESNLNQINNQSRVRRPSETPIMNNELFWTYNQNDQEEKDSQEKKAPQMLIRCVNQFSDIDPKSEKGQD